MMPSTEQAVSKVSGAVGGPAASEIKRESATARLVGAGMTLQLFSFSLSEADVY